MLICVQSFKMQHLVNKLSCFRNNSLPKFHLVSFLLVIQTVWLTHFVQQRSLKSCQLCFAWISVWNSSSLSNIVLLPLVKWNKNSRQSFTLFDCCWEFLLHSLLCVTLINVQNYAVVWKVRIMVNCFVHLKQQKPTWIIVTPS